MPNDAQTKKIWAAAREVGMEEDELRDLVEAVSCQRSIRELGGPQTRDLIDRLVALGARPGQGAPRKRSGRREPAGVVKMITGAQRGEIERRRAELGGNWVSDAYFAGACRKRIHKDAPSTAAEGAKVIEMLKKVRTYKTKGARAG